MDFIVGTFRHPLLYTLTFTPPSTLDIKSSSDATGGHSWLALSPDHKFLYTTCWTSPPQVAAYDLSSDKPKLINTAPVATLSGYVTVTPDNRYLLSVGGPGGEVFALGRDGSIGKCVQTLQLRRTGDEDLGQRIGVAHGDFGGLRHGAHSVDISPDGKTAYIADIGANGIWSFHISEFPTSQTWEGGETQVLETMYRHASPRATDGPRHALPHPNGKVLYCVQEHSSMVDAFSLLADGSIDKHLGGVKIIPDDKDPKDFWADEVRLSRTSSPPKYLYASTRGLEKSTKGYVAVFRLDDEGHINEEIMDMYETETSGGLANAIEPAPRGGDGIEYIALTDSEQGFVSILAFTEAEGKIKQVAKVKLTEDNGNEEVIGAATAVWL
ncbi:hypothetical protein MBLNU457_1844t1 [Dothideomycetes sp. NU457]